MREEVFKGAETLFTDINPYPLDRPVSLSIISWIPSIFKAKNSPDENTGRINLRTLKVDAGPDLAEGLKDSSKHFFGDVEVQRPHVQTHRP